MATTTSLSEMSATIARRPPHRHAKTSTRSIRRSRWAHAIRVPATFPTPSPRRVGRRLGATLSRSGDVPSAVATHGDASSGTVRVVVFVLARGNVGVPPALATGPLGTTAARSGERGANTPEKRCNGKRGGGIKAAILAKYCTGVITRCVTPLRLGLRSGFGKRPLFPLPRS